MTQSQPPQSTPETKHTVIILAGGSNSRFSESVDSEHGCLVTVHQKALLEWTIEAFARSPAVEHIIVVGSEEIEELAAMRYVRKRVFGGLSRLQSLLHAITYVKTVLYRNSNKHNGYVVTFGNLPLLTPAMVTQALGQIDQSDADLIGWYAEHQQRLDAGGMGREATIDLGGKPAVVSGLYYVRRLTQLTNALDALQQLEDQLEDPQHALQRLGCAGKSLSVTESILSDRFGAKVELLRSEHPQWTMSVNSQESREAAERLLQSPWKHSYKKVKLIANPNAGKGLTFSPVLRKLLGLPARGPAAKQPDIHQTLESIRKELTTYGIEAEIARTTKAGDARDMAEACVRENYDLIIAVGGDGTINEIANVLAETNVVLGVIPFGTANVLGVQLRLPMRPRAACQVIAGGNSQRIDLGRSNGRYFVCMAGIGFDAQIVKEAEGKPKAFLGALAFWVVGITQALTYRFRRIVLKIDSEKKRRWGYFVVIGNGKYYAGDMIIASKAELTDGKLDVCIFKHRDIPSLIAYLFGMRHGDIDRYLDVEYIQCERVQVLKHGSHGVHVDAEYLGETPVDIEVVPQALRVAT